MGKSNSTISAGSARASSLTISARPMHASSLASDVDTAHASSLTSGVAVGTNLMGEGRRVILHSDMNAFYASVECLHRPELRDVPMAVGGDVEKRHGIILAKNRLAKAQGVKTAMALWEARRACPGLVIVPPDYGLYMKYSRLARRIYYDYTDLVEPFGPDEAWLDITGSVELFGGDPLLVAREISERVKAELGVTVSVGVSWNKVFAKFASDGDPGDGLVVITPENYQEKVWPRPASELIYVGRATERKLAAMGVGTVGELAATPVETLRHRLGKMGEVLWAFANGLDVSPVKCLDPSKADVDYVVKSIGNGLTAPRDLSRPEEVKVLTWLLAESVTQRLRACGRLATTVSVGVRHAADLAGYTRQRRLAIPTSVTGEVARAAFGLIVENEPLDGTVGLRGLWVRACNLVPVGRPRQTTLFDDEERRRRLELLDETIDGLRHRFGNDAVRRACVLGDEMSELDIERDNVVHPVGFFSEEDSGAGTSVSFADVPVTSGSAFAGGAS